MNVLDKEKSEQDKSDKGMLIAVLVIIAVITGIVSLKFFTKNEPQTIEELHELNLQGKLAPSQGYIYNGYSFVNVSNFWYTQIQSPNDRILYSLNFRFGPRQLEDIPIEGRLNATLFDDSEEYFVTFDPLGFMGDFTYVTLAVNDFNQNMVKAFDKRPIAACDKNVTAECRARPVINCSNTEQLVFYIQEAEIPRILLDDNCIIIEGKDFGLVRAVDKLVLKFYGIM